MNMKMCSALSVQVIVYLQAPALKNVQNINPESNFNMPFHQNTQKHIKEAESLNFTGNS